MFTDSVNSTIAFLNPPYKYMIQRKLRCSPIRSGYMFPPMELLYLVSVTRDVGKPVFIDAVAEKLGIKEVTAKLQQYHPKIIVFMPGFESLSDDLDAMSVIKKRLGGSCYLVGFGYLMSLFYKQIFRQYPAIDFTIVGEPERTFVELCGAIIKGIPAIETIRGLVIKRSNSFVVNERRDNEPDLDALPFPDRSFLKNSLYSDPFLEKPMTAVVTSRGCPFHCNFCANFYGSPFRMRSAENVINELKDTVNRHHIHNIRFMDDNFTADRKRLIDICKGIVANRLNIQFTCLSRADTLDEEMLRFMAGAGCKMIFLGVESGSQKILDYYKKEYSLDIIRQKCRLIKKAGIDITCWFIIGAPSETPEDLKKSIQFALDIDADFVCINELKPLPGTPLFRELENIIKFSLIPFSISYVPAHLSRQKVSCRRQKFYLKFYCAPRTVRKVLLRLVRNPRRFMFFIREFTSVMRSRYIEK